MMELSQLISRIGLLGVAMETAMAAAIEESCVILENSAKAAIGTYSFGWQPLAPSTLARKKADTPLYETGELQASYEHNADGLEGYVGSDNPKAAWAEWGTSRAPARPVLGGALMECEPQIEALVGKHAAEVMERG